MLQSVPTEIPLMKSLFSSIFFLTTAVLTPLCVPLALSEEINSIPQQAAAGDREAQYQLAECYRIGKELEQDWELAYQWYKKSAEQDYTPAMHALSLCLIDGYGTEKNPQEGIKILTICAERGYMKSIHAIINVYMLGCKGIEKNLDVAKKWAKIGAEQGDVACMSTYGVLLVDPSFGINQTEEGKMWLRRAAQGGDQVAQFELGLIYFNGSRGENKDYVEAKNWFVKAAAQEHASAIFMLATLYHQGLGVETNYELAAQLCLRAALMNCANAQANLAVLYTQGRGVPENLDHALYWAKRAAENGDPHGDRVYHIIRLYYNSDNVVIPDTPQDIDFNFL